MANRYKITSKTTFNLILIWAVINIVLMLMMLPEDFMDLNNWIELALWGASIPCLLYTKKWGIAFVIFTLCYTFSTSVGIIIYYQIWLNAIRILVNGFSIVYLFKTLINSNLK
ncbi:MAG: hypothetical protein IAX21_01970 [Candidatus Bathyarchaeota archaeon]|nr:MAG: hypothetical protein NUK63_03835 [Candidatus Bathyarchaeum tardum]WNZ29662.1 MAG: hypothetical protein IAX21_01970 [Candidatus Bathyarchaeota archaeon]